MTHFFQCNRKQKREDCEDVDHFVPSAKRAKLKTAIDTPDETALGHPFIHLTNSASQHASPHKVCWNWIDQTVKANHIVIQVEVHQERSNMNVTYQRGIAQYNIAQTDGSYVTEEYIRQMDYKYLPDLNASENPHYYENNRLLFELYVERTQRSLCHPNTSPV